MMGELYQSIIKKDHILAAYHRIHEKFFDPYLQLYKPFVVGIDGIDLIKFGNDLDASAEECLSFLASRKMEFSPQILRKVPKDKPGDFREVYLNTLRDKVIQKAIASILTKEFEKFHYPNLYSYRGKSYGQMTAARKVSKLLREQHHKLYIFKTDVPDFTDNINQAIMLEKFRELLPNEPEVIELLEKYVRQQRCTNGVISTPKMGIPTGSSLTTVCANLYLRELDRAMFRRDAIYFRFGDDILLITRSQKEVDEGEKIIDTILQKNKLRLSDEKTERYQPGEDLEYLGYRFQDKTIDIASKSLRKYRLWIKEILPKNKFFEHPIHSPAALKEMVQRAVIDMNTETERGLAQLPWIRSFPIINTDESVKALDSYIKDRIRLCILGKLTVNARKSIPEAWFRELGYKSLTGAYYRISRRRPFGPYHGWRLYFGTNYYDLLREEEGYFAKKIRGFREKWNYLKESFGGRYLPQIPSNPS